METLQCLGHIQSAPAAPLQDTPTQIGMALVLPTKVSAAQLWLHCTNAGVGQGDFMLFFSFCFQTSLEDAAIHQHDSFAERLRAFN